MIDPEAIKTIAIIIGVAFTSVSKFIDTRKKKGARKRVADKLIKEIDIYEELNTRMDEFDEIIAIPEGVELPEGMEDLILQRNYYQVNTQYFKRKCHDLELKLEAQKDKTKDHEPEQPKVSIAQVGYSSGSDSGDSGGI